MDLIFIFFLIGTGLCAGFLAGLLGVGGGFLFAPAMFFVLRTSGVDDQTAILVAFCTSLAAALPTILTSALSHKKLGHVSVKTALIIGICGACFGAVGALVASILPVKVLTILFGCLLIIAAVRLVTSLPSGEKTTISPLPAAGIGGVAGFLSGLLGVGGGTIIVPLMTLFGKFSMKRAVGTSAFAIVFITCGGIISYLINGVSAGIDLSASGFIVFGYLELSMWIILVICAVPMAYVSSHCLSGKISDKVLRRLFCVLMFFVALHMFGVFEWIAGLF